MTIALRDPSSWAARNAVIDLHRFALPLTKDRASRPTEYGAWGAERWWTQDGSTPCTLPCAVVGMRCACCKRLIVGLVREQAVPS